MDRKNKPAAMQVSDFNAGINGEVFPEAGNKDVHTPGGEVAIVPPDPLQGNFPGQERVFVLAQKFQQFSFLG